MRIYKEPSYLPPEGHFPGTITLSRLVQDEKNAKTRQSIRLSVDLDPIPGEPMMAYKARIDWWEPQANEFLRFAARLLGPDVHLLVDANGEIRAENLYLLEGHRIEFDVIHERKPGHDHAYRKVVNPRPERMAA